MKRLFKLRGQLDTRTNLILGLCGFFLFIALWILATSGSHPLVNTSILPKPGDVFSSFSEMYKENNLVQNMFRSIGLNIAGYVEAVLLALPLGFVIGLYPLFRGSFQRLVDAIRYIPLTAVTGIFIAAYGLGVPMKVHFLAFGIFIYLLPVVVQRIDEVKEVYLKTVYTIGATDWQTIKTVYIPSVISRISDDIRVLTAISWTYIIVAESLGNFGGVGALIWRAGLRQGRIDKVYALLIIIMLFGVLQDRLFTYLDKEFFAHKYQGKSPYDKAPIGESNAIKMALSFFGKALLWISLVGYVLLFANELFNDSFKPLSYLFGGTSWVIHFLVFSVLVYNLYQLWYKRKYAYLFN